MRTLLSKSEAAFIRAKYNKLKFKLGSANKAKVAVANRLARVIYKILAGDKYKDIGYARACDHEDKIKMLINQIKALGVAIRQREDCFRASCNDQFNGCDSELIEFKNLLRLRRGTPG